MSLDARSGAMLAAALVAAAVFCNALGGPFVYDDVVEIQDNERIHSLSRIPELIATDFWGAGEGRNPLYRPLTAVVMAAVWAAGGGGPFLYHLLNVLLHAAASALVVSVLLSLTGRLPMALAAGLLFAAHPVHTEAVAWISGLGELLSAVCLLAAWRAHAQGGVGAAAAWMAPALLSKEGAIVFPALAMTGDWLAWKVGAGARGAGPGAGRGAARGLPRAPAVGRWVPRWSAYGAYAGVACGYLALRLMVLGHVFGGIEEGPRLLNPLRDLGVMERVMTSVVVVGQALMQSVWPATLCLDYGYNQIPAVAGLMDPRLLASAGGLAALAGGIFWWLRRRPVGGAAGSGKGAQDTKGAAPGSPRPAVAAAGAALFLLAFLPASNLLFPGISAFAERNLYLPVLGLCMMAAALLDVGWRGRAGAGAGSGMHPVLVAGVGLLVAAAGARTLARNPDFGSKIALYGSAARACPSSARAHMFWGVALREEGRTREGLAAQQRSLAIAPDYADARSEYGLGLMLLGDLAGAERELKETLRLDPMDREARSNLSSLYAATGRLHESVAEAMEAARLFPDDPDVLNNYASSLIDVGQAVVAEGIFSRLKESHKESPHGPNGLGALLAREGRWGEAAPLFQEAVRRKPGDANAALNLAQALWRTGRTPEALAALEEAIRAARAGAGVPGGGSSGELQVGADTVVPGGGGIDPELIRLRDALRSGAPPPS